MSVLDFGAKGDGRTDDTAAIKAAIAATYQAWEQVYLPGSAEGRTYVVSDEISWGTFITLRGDGRGRTIVKLADAAPGYGDATMTKSVFLCRRNGRADVHDNTSHSNYVMDMTIDVGRGNPGAVGIDYTSHNGGMVKNVELRAPAGSGAIGISMDRDGPGPAHVVDTTVSGFDYGMSTSWGAYSMSFENIAISGQRKAGFRSNAHNTVIERLSSTNTVPAVEVVGGRDYGLFTLLDSTLSGGSAEHPAIVSDGELFIRDVATQGYSSAVRDGGRVVTGPRVAEYSSSPVRTAGGASATSLRLPTATPPVIPWQQDTSAWVGVDSFADRARPGDAAPAIQAAIDTGSPTVYFPSNTHGGPGGPYETTTDVVVRGPVQRIVGMSARITGDLVIDTDQSVEIEQLRVDGEIRLRGTGSVNVVGGMFGSLVKETASGDSYLQDVVAGTIRVEGGRLWGRQVNVESDVAPKIVNDGGTVRLVNLKTEFPSTVLANRNGARTEILGGLIYSSQGTPTVPMYSNDASSLLGVVHRELGGAYPTFVQENGQAVDPPFEHGTRYVTRPPRTRATAPPLQQRSVVRGTRPPRPGS
ncbi:MAG: glycosyl hydrolase family 28-related protein [Phycicoccus sp.]